MLGEYDQQVIIMQAQTRVARQGEAGTVLKVAAIEPSNWLLD